MTVRKLSSYVRSQLQSGLTITDATQCTLELVENSLDAKATAIAVRVNLSEFTIEVVDNGLGISSQDLKLIGKRHMTSKCHDFDDLNDSFVTYGYRGQGLASIAETCEKLVIKTKYKMNKETVIKIFRNGETPSLFVSSKDRSGNGTTVTVHGFMCKMPVRRKRISEVFDLQDIKSQMEYLAIIHNEVCFTLRDENKGEILLQTHKKTDPRMSIRDLFGFASDKCFKPFSYREKNIAVQGYLSLRRHFESNLKFLYVNNRIVLKSMVHKLVDLCIDKYFRENHDILQKMTVFDGINLNLPKNNHNVYILKIYCPYTHFVMFRNLRKATVEFKDWDVVLTCIKRAIKSALCFKSSVPELEKIDKNLARDCKRVPPRNEQAVGNLKNGIKGGLVRREFHPENLKQGNKNENLRHSTEGLGVGQNNISGCNKFSKSELTSSSESHSSGCNQDPTFLSQSPIPKENYLNAKENSVPSDLTESVPGEKINSMEYTDFLDFLAWFRSKIKQDSKIYNYFVKYEHNFRNLKINTYSDEVDRKLLNNKSLANKPKCKGVRKRKEEGNRKEIKSYTLLRKSKKTRTSLVKQTGTDKMKGSKGTKRNNCAQHSSGLTSKRLKVEVNVRNNLCEDLVLPESQNNPANISSGSWFSHQSRLDLASQTDDVETRSFGYLRPNIDEGETKQTFSPKKNKLKRKEEAQVRDGIRKGAEVTSKRTNLEYKDFGVQTDKDFVVTLCNDKPNTYCSTPNVKSVGFQCEINSSSLKENVVNRPSSMDIINEQACHKAKTSSSPTVNSSLQLDNLKITSQELSPFSVVTKNTETMSVNDSDMFCERLSDKLSRKTASEKLNDFLKMPCPTGSASVNCRSQSNLVHRDPLNVNGRNRTASLERCSSYPTFTFTERYNFIPKGLSQSALDRSPVNDFETKQQDNDLVQTSGPPVNTFNLSEVSGPKSMLPCNIFGELREKTDENMIYYEKQLITASIVNKEAEIFSLGTVTIDKEELSDITVMGQWDKKFILAAVDVISSKQKKFLAIFDQHAADERIILEKLLNEFRTSDGHFVSVCCNPPIKCIIKESVGRLLPSFENKLADCGIKASVIGHENVLLHEIPLCFAHESILEKTESFFQNLLNNIVEELNETRGTIPGIPKVYYDVISTRACKNAVKFNDVLSNSAMKKMMNDLMTCQIPFQCAHGRPCIVPILDVEGYKRQFKREESKLNFMKFSTSNPYRTETSRGESLVGNGQE